MSETITGVFKYAVIPNDTTIPAAYRLPDIVTIAATADIVSNSGYAIELTYTGRHGVTPTVTNFAVVQAASIAVGAEVQIGVLDNAGTILGGFGTMSTGFGDPLDGREGVFLDGGFAENSGQISGGNGVAYGMGGDGLYLRSGSFTNFATGLVNGGNGGGDGTGGTGLYAESGTIQNYGILRGGAAGGTIAGGESNKAPPGSYAGAGLILHAYDGFLPLLETHGQIIGGTGAVGGDGAEFTGNFNTLTGSDFVNDGSIAGGHGTGSGGIGLLFASYSKAGSITNYGTFPAINSETFVNSISNAGTITGGSGNISGGDGILNTGTLFLANSGDITGGASAGKYNYGADGISLANGSVNNSGVIAGGSGHYYGGAGIYIENAGTVIDSGTISGGAGPRSNGIAVQFHSGASRLILEHGADLIGGASADAAFTNVLELGSGTGSLGGIGVLFNSATDDAGITGFSSFAFDPSAAWTIAGTAAGFAGAEVSGFSAFDTFDITGLAATLPETVTLGVNDVLAIPKTGGGILDITFAADAGVVFTLSSDGHGGTLITEEVCFAEGTRIATPQGEMAVEALSVGDLVTTLEGPRPVTWLGYRAVDLSHFKDPESGYLVRICKGAFAENTPRRDLLVTQEHCIFVDGGLPGGGLIPARMLINDRSIFIDKTINKYTYYHVELAEHGILLAEGLAAESYLDTGNRGNFANAETVAMRPEFAVNVGQKNWADAVAPLTVAAEAVEPVWQRLNTRAWHLGVARRTPAPVLTGDPDLHLVTGDGEVIRPVRRNGEKYFFMVRPGAAALRLVSRTARPSETVGPYIDDRRALGVQVGEITLHDGRRKITIDGHLVGTDLPGWFGLDHPAHRWTNGNAELPVALDTLRAPAAILEIRIVQAGPYQVGVEINKTDIAA